ncbi:hypothetical protein PCE1_001376 [Barthelona sp. PCE]
MEDDIVTLQGLVYDILQKKGQIDQIRAHVRSCIYSTVAEDKGEVAVQDKPKIENKEEFKIICTMFMKFLKQHDLPFTFETMEKECGMTISDQEIENSLCIEDVLHNPDIARKVSESQETQAIENEISENEDNATISPQFTNLALCNDLVDQKLVNFSIDEPAVVQQPTTHYVFKQSEDENAEVLTFDDTNEFMMMEESTPMAIVTKPEPVEEEMEEPAVEEPEVQEPEEEPVQHEIKKKKRTMVMPSFTELPPMDELPAIDDLPPIENNVKPLEEGFAVVDEIKEQEVEVGQMHGSPIAADESISPNISTLSFELEDLIANVDNISSGTSSESEDDKNVSKYEFPANQMRLADYDIIINL